MRNIICSILIVNLFVLTGCVANKTDVTNIRLDIRELQREIALLRKSQAELIMSIEHQNDNLSQLSGKVDDNRTKFSEIDNKVVKSSDLDMLSERLQSVESRLYKLWVSTMPIAAASDVDIYNTAYSDYSKGKHDLALSGYRKYLESYSDGEYSAAAQYGIALIYYELENWDKCEEELEVFVSLYPDSDVIIKAKLMKARTLRRQRNFSQAIKKFEEIVKEYPNTEESKFARDELDSLSLDNDKN